MPVSAKPSKREITRLKVIEAAIECIYNDGFHAAHTNRIAEAAGVSWGVLQYHFGDKDGLLQAVLDHIFDDFSTTLKKTRLEGDDLQGRISQLIDLVWSLVSKREYRVSVAILRNAGKDQSSSINGDKQINEWAQTTSNLWDRLFDDTATEPQRRDHARHILFATLRGMADEINPRGRSKKALQEERTVLAEALTHILTKAV
jgi:AcrR family transcriptional regulator